MDLNLRDTMDSGLEVALAQPEISLPSIMATIVAGMSGLAVLGAVKHRMTQSQMVERLAALSGADKKAVAKVLKSLPTLAASQLKAGHDFVLPGMVHLQSVRKPARKARMGTNPFTGEKQKFKAKPASRKVKARVLKVVRDAV